MHGQPRKLRGPPGGAPSSMAARRHSVGSGHSVLSQKYVGIREPMHPILRRRSSVEYRPVDMRPPRALHDARLGPLGASTYFWDRALEQSSQGDMDPAVEGTGVFADAVIDAEEPDPCDTP